MNQVHRTFVALLGALLCCATQHADAQSTTLLRDRWELQSSIQVPQQGAVISQADFTPEAWYPASVPTTVLAALVKNGVYPDPFYGDNITHIPGYKKGPWLVMPEDSPFRPSWWYRTVFTMSVDDAGKQLTLHLDGINYKANIWLNGHLLADSETVIGMFRRFAFPITDLVNKDGKNCLAIEVTAPGHLEDKPYRTKQLEATTGWDDHNPQPPDLNMGLWQDVYVRATGPVAISHPYVAADLEVPALAAAHLTVSAELTNHTSIPVQARLSGSIETIAFSKEILLAPHERTVVTFTPREYDQLTIPRPRVWWPHPVGPQELYDLDLTATVNAVPSDSCRTRFGIRKAATYINNEGWRGYQINGKNILIRGGAWMTSDMLLRLTHDRYDALIRYAREAGLNMLRSEGFSIRETDEFYALCDQYGIMVTQQIFGRSIPDEDLAIDCTEDTLRRIRNHPSLVHFLGHDETFPTPRLDAVYRGLIARYAPDRSYQPHSGAFEVEERFKTGGTRTGTRELWTYANPAHYYTHKEDGAWGFAQSGGIGGVIAPIQSLRKMMPEAALWPLWSDTASLHTVLQGAHYFDAMTDALTARYGAPTDIGEFCRAGQAMNYESARGMFEAYARNKYSATGITPWKYDAAWPASPTWQYVDWYLQVGGAYYGAQKACEPLHIQYSYDDHSVYVVNSFYKSFVNLEARAQVLNLDMTEKLSKKATVNVGADGKVQAFLLTMPDGLSKTYFLSLKLLDRGGKQVSNNLYWLSTVPDIPGEKKKEDWTNFKLEPKSTADLTDLKTLPAVRLNVHEMFGKSGDESTAKVRIVNPSRTLAFMVHLALTRGPGGPEVTPAFWQENYFSLLPGETRTVCGAVYTKDLEGAAPAVSVDGWNVEEKL